MTDPKVSFVVPSYMYARYLGDCVESVLSQTYGDFEVIIMDDHSPDDTPEVAAKFKDPRVIYVRNETNIGAVRNYNKGIELSRGRYIWLISADDFLRSRRALQRYVDLLEKNPHVGYVFCPAMTIREGRECGVEDWTAWPGKRNRILSGREVVRRSVGGCPVCAPAGLARKECYARIGGFPSSLPRCGDWYLWGAFATMFDVGYFAEPMVCYRRHAASMEKTLEEEQPSLFFEQEILVRWLIKKEAEKAGMRRLSSDFYNALADEYTKRLVAEEVRNGDYGYTWDFATREIRGITSSEQEAEGILRLIRANWPRKLSVGHTRVGASCYKTRRLNEAIIAFQSAVALTPWRVKPRVYLWASGLEQKFGIRIVPWLKAFKKVLP